MSQDWDPWAEVVRPILSSLVCNLKPSQRMLNHLHARKLICDSEMETLIDLLNENERSHILLTKYLPRRKADFLPFCDVLLAMDDESQKKIGWRLRDALGSRRGPHLEDSLSPGGFGQLQHETPSTELHRLPNRKFESLHPSSQRGQDRQPVKRESQFQGITSSKKSKMDVHVTLSVPQQLATSEFKSTAVTTPINIVEHAMSSTGPPAIPRQPSITLPSGRDQLYEGYSPCLDEQFVGRDDLVKSLTEKLIGLQNATVVSGPPGMGKTSVANAVCLEYLKHEGIGPCYRIELRDVVTTVDDVHMLCCKWVTDTISHTDDSNDIKNLSRCILRSLPSKSIIVVDACEKATPCIISNFLCDANAVTNGQVRFLLTSQVAMNKHQLRVPSLHEVRLNPLSKEDSLKILKYEKETLSEDALTDMKAIGDLLHGVPLALSLASTMFRLEYTPRALLTRLQKEGLSSTLSADSDELGKGMRTVLVEFFDLILEKGGKREHRAAICASIFPGTISQEAFDHVCDVSLEGGTPQVVEATASVNPKLIASLTKWHVLERCRGIDESNPRYQMHAYIKEYAARVLNDRETPDLLRTVKESFLVYFAKLLKHIAKEEETRQSFKDTGGLFALDRELENIRGFLTHLTDGQTLGQCSVLATSLVLKALTSEEVGNLLSLRFTHDKRLNTLRCVYNSVETIESAQVKSGLLLEMAKVLRGLGRFKEALDKVRQAHQLCVEGPTDKEKEANCLEVLGSIEFRQHRSGFANAETSLTAALRLARENFKAAKKCQKNDSIMRCSRRLASVCKTLGELRSRQRKSDEAIALFQEADSFYRQSTGREVVSRTWLMHRIGNNYQTAGQLDKAKSAYFEGLHLCEKYRAEKHVVYAKLNYSLGRLYQYLDGKHQSKSLEHYNKARSLQETLNPDHPDLVQTYIGIGRVRNVLTSNPRDTLQLFEKAQTILDNAPRKPGESDFPMAELCSARAVTYRQMGRFQDELESVTQAYDIYNKSSDIGDSLDKKKANCMRDMGHAYRRLGRRNESSRCFREERRLRSKAKGQKK